MSPLESWLRANGDITMFALFFGLIALFAILETAMEMREHGADRRRRWPVNWAITILNIVLMGAAPLSGLVVADWAAESGTGLLNRIDLAWWTETLVAMLAFSLQSWAVHYAMHYVPVLWRFHRVHHTDTHMDVSTTVRFHPLEMLLQMPVSAAIIVALGAPTVAVIVYGLLDAAINVFSHSNIRLPAGVDRALSWLIVTPHLHRVHHSTIVRETNSNFGATLPVWDMLFGTYRAKEVADLSSQPIGLDEMQDERAYSLWWVLTLPFRAIRRSSPPARTDASRSTRPL